MTEPTPGAVPPVTDRRGSPRGVMPRHLQTWLMAGLALAILAIIVFTGDANRARRTAPAASGAQPVAPDAGRLRDLQDRLRLIDERARQQAAERSRDDEQPRVRQESSTPQPDPIAADRKRRDYESLFAGVLVSSGRPNQQLRGAGAETATTGSVADGRAAVNTLDGLAEALVRAALPTVQAPDNRAAATPAHNARDVRPPSSRHSAGSGSRLRQGVLIPVTLVNRIDSSSPGPVICQVTEPVLSEGGQQVLIPAGARLLGISKPAQGQDASRVAITFHTLQIDRDDHPLDDFVSLNGIGETGLRDKVDHHYWSTFGAASLVGLLSGVSQLATTAGLARGDGDRTIVIAGTAGDGAARATAQTLDRLLQRTARILVMEGYRFHVYVNRDLDLPTYESDSSAAISRATP